MKAISHLVRLMQISFILFRYNLDELIYSLDLFRPLRFFGYLNFLRPFVFIFTGYVFFTIYKTIHKKYALLVIVAVLTVIILPKSVKHLDIDPFSIEMIRRVQAIETKHPDKKFKIYGCKGVLSGWHTSTTKSLTFLLESKSKFSDSGIKLGVYDPDCKYSSLESLTNDGKKYSLIANTGVIDFSGATDSWLKENGWIPISFQSISDEITRWWFKEQP
mgnify:CR=1 FL=1